jgi:Outer membrane protein
LKKTLCRIGLAVALCAASAAASAQPKIGFVNPARVSADAPQAMAAREKLEKEFSARREELARAQKELKELEAKLNRDAAVMTEAERSRAERDLLARSRELRRMQDELREDYNIRGNEELAKLQRRIIEVIHQLAKEEKFDLIVGDGVIYASEQIDITSKVVERLKQEYRNSTSK